MPYCKFAILLACISCNFYCLLLPLFIPEKWDKPRQLHNSQWGIICPAETPEGQVRILLSKHTHIILYYYFLWGKNPSVWRLWVWLDYYIGVWSGEEFGFDGPCNSRFSSKSYSWIFGRMEHRVFWG